MKKIINLLYFFITAAFIAGILIYSYSFKMSQVEKHKPLYENTIKEIEKINKDSFSVIQLNNICQDNSYLLMLKFKNNNRERLFIFPDNIEVQEFDKKFFSFGTKLINYKQSTYVNGKSIQIIYKITDKKTFQKYLITIAVSSAIFILLVILLIIITIVFKKEKCEISPEEMISIDFVDTLDKFLAESEINTKDISICFIHTSSEKIYSEKFLEAFSLLDTHIKFNNGFIEKNGKLISIILPDTKLHEGMKLIEKFTNTIRHIKKKTTMCSGLSGLNGRKNLSSTQFVKEATGALFKAMETSSNEIIGFHADPAKFNTITNPAQTE